MAGGGEGPHPEAPDVDDRVVVQHEVVPGQAGGVRRAHPDGVAGPPEGGDGLDVVPVPVGGEHPSYAQSLAQLQEQAVFVGRVDQHGLPRPGAADDEDVVVDGPDDGAGDGDLAVLVVERGGAHGVEYAPCTSG